MSLPNTASRAWLFIQFLLLWTFLMRAPLAAGQELSPPPQNRLALDVRSRLAEAARDVTLAPWQRTFMLDVACGRMEGTATEPSPALPELALPTFGFAANDGVWNGFPAPPARYRHTAIYDPVRDRIVVFGGNSGSSQYNDVWALSLAGSPATMRMSIRIVARTVSD